MPAQEITGVLVSDNGDGTANVQIGPFGYTVDLGYLFTGQGGVTDPSQAVIHNVTAYLRQAGYSELSDEARAAVAGHVFRF